MLFVARRNAIVARIRRGPFTPGFLTTVTAYLQENPDPTPEEARECISGNLCRCTGYQNIIKSVLRAAEITKEREATS